MTPAAAAMPTATTGHNSSASFLQSSVPSLGQGTNHSSNNVAFANKEKPMQVRLSNITAAKAVADVIRSSLGPRGMDKMIKTGSGEVIITNDGATILKHMAVLHPCAKMLVELSAAQDIEAGDGTTSVVILAGSLLGAAEKLLEKGIHPTVIGDAFLKAGRKGLEILEGMAKPISLSDRELMVKIAATSLSSKVVAPCANHIAGIAVDAVKSVAGLGEGKGGEKNLAAFALLAGDVDLKDIRVIGKVGGTIEDAELMQGILLTQPIGKGLTLGDATMPTRIEKAKVALVQFQLSSPKTDMEGQVVVTDYQQMDRILKEERAYILNICKKIKKTGCTALLVQKSILRDSLSELALHYLAKLKIMVIGDIERDEVDFIARSLGIRPIADIESFTEEKLVTVDLIEEIHRDGGATLIQIIPPATTVLSGINTTSTLNTSTNITNSINPPSTTTTTTTAAAASSNNPTTGTRSNVGGTTISVASVKTATILVRGGNSAILAEAERSLHDALCVARCLVRRPFLICAGGAPEIEMSLRLGQWARNLARGPESLCVEAFAEALEVIPTILAENAGLDPVSIVTELRNRHSNLSSDSAEISSTNSGSNYGINVRKADVADMANEFVFQPLLVSTSALQLATEAVAMIMKIDDIVQSR